MKTIPLTKGYAAIVDDEDYALVSQWKWRALVRPEAYTTKVYAVRQEWPSGKTILMHRLLTGAPPKTVVDHADGDSLNNRRGNIRVCTQQENTRNAAPKGGNRTGFKGVSRTPLGKFKAAIRFDGRAHHLGVFETAEMAAAAYDAAALKSFGKFAKTNAQLAQFIRAAQRVGT